MREGNFLQGILAELAEYFGYVLTPRPGLGWADIFFYTFPRITNIAAAATSAPSTITIQDDSDFEWLASAFQFNVAQAAITVATQNIPNMAVNIIDTGSGKQLMNANTPVTSIFGRPGQPIYLPHPRILTRNSVYSITAQNYDAAVATGDLWLTLIGRKLYNAR
jgi:hypothetical protein